MFMKLNSLSLHYGGVVFPPHIILGGKDDEPYCPAIWNNDVLLWWLSGKESVCHAAEKGSLPGSGRSPGEENSNPLQYSCLGNPMDGEALWATVDGGQRRAGYDLVTKQQ